MKRVEIAGKDSGQRLDKYLKKLLPEAGTSFLYKMLRKKNICLNDKKASGQELLKTGDILNIYFSDETYEKFHGGNGGEAAQRRENALEAYHSLKGIRIIYENDDLLFLDKPTGIVSQREKKGEVSLNDWVYGYAIENAKLREDENYIPSIMNRLDRNTEGLVMAALSYAGSRYLAEIIRDRRVRKFYHATVEGRLEGEGVLNGYLTKDEAENKVSIRDTESKDSVPVRTAYKVLAHNHGYTELEVELITGKSHQIRAHLASIGHPIAGDGKYGGHPYKGRHFQQLKAVRLEFPADMDDPYGLAGKSISIL